MLFRSVVPPPPVPPVAPGLHAVVIEAVEPGKPWISDTIKRGPVVVTVNALVCDPVSPLKIVLLSIRNSELVASVILTRISSPGLKLKDPLIVVPIPPAGTVWSNIPPDRAEQPGDVPWAYALSGMPIVAKSPNVIVKIDSFPQ